MSTSQIDRIANALGAFGQSSIVVLSGVAGTGKSHYAVKAAEKFTGSPLFVRNVQFHPVYGYEDLIEGLQPTSTGGFVLRDGALIDWNAQALKDSEHKYVFLIEELTRANVSAVLGEFFTYVEYRDRSFLLPISRRQTMIARNLYLLATMNPQDKSALELDDALLRRMNIFPFPPSISELQSMLSASLSGLDGAVRDNIIAGLSQMFAACEKAFPESYADLMPFGHAVFSSIRNEQDLTDLWRQRLRFLLQRSPHVPPHPFKEVISANYKWQ